MLIHALRRVLLLSGFLAVTASAALRPERLQADSRENPLGLDTPAPRLAWIDASVEPGARAESQTAYRLLVASSADLLAREEGDLWDSGKTFSDRSSDIAYAGRPLVSSQRVYWKVRVWDQAGKPGPWSEPSSWTMGLLAPADWAGARWLGAPDADQPVSLNGPKARYETVLLRREFTVRPGLLRATLHVTGLGQYELTLNGEKVGADLFAPGWTAYDKTVLYDTFDLTASLHPGANTAGLFLGNGMYLSHRSPGRYIKEKGWAFEPLQAIALLRLDYADGSVETIVTDQEWRVASGPVTYSSVYGGEDHDARLEPVWEAPRLLAGPGGVLRGRSFAAPPLRAFDVFKPVATRELKPGVTVYDFGQNASIVPRLAVAGPAGSRVRITPSELVRPNGDLNDTMSGGRGFWTYTLKGGAPETWTPRFFYRGARYLKVELLPAASGEPAPAISSLESVVVHTAAAPVGEFATSNELFNRIHTLVRWAQRSNLASVLTDCPTREKLGWLEQYHLNGPALRYNYDLAALFTKGVQDMIDSQTPSGLVPSIAPEYVKFGGDGDANPFRNSPEWGSALVLAPWQQYEFHGDLALLRQAYVPMKRYLAYLDTKAQGRILDFGLGDWYDLGPKPPGASQLTPRALTATAFYYEVARILGRVAALLGRADEAASFTAQAADIRAAFNAKFYHADTHSYATGSQCANALPLVMDLVEPADRAAVLANLVADVEAKGLTAGDVGYRYLLRALSDGGRSDVVYAMNNQSEKPGYGYQLAKGATALTEAWDAREKSSQNHFMLGQINEWFYHDLAGIQCDPAGPGFRKIIIKPAVVGDLTFVKARYDSSTGPISTEWRRAADNTLTLAVTIPANTTATVVFPAPLTASITEGGRPLARASGVRPLTPADNHPRVEIGSGSYTFQIH